MRKALVILLSALVIPTLFGVPDPHAEERKMGSLSIGSAAFPHNGTIPPEHTCDGADTSPPLSIRNVPAKARSLALVVDDPDAPGKTWVHWLAWNIGADTAEIPSNAVPPGALQGRNDFGKTAYGGPCPPSGTHRYFFKLYALDAVLPLKAGAAKEQLEAAMKGHILEKAELIGLYRRK
jgi:Raf kinase inhibitor-like YbhB/YbcL family protein